MSDRRCASPIELPTLIEYWVGDPPSSVQAQIEEHLFACEACAAEAARFAELAAAVRDTVRRGVVRAVVTHSFLERISLEGQQLRRYELAPGGSVACTVGPEDEFVVVRLAVDLRDAENVDFVWCDDRGQEQERLVGIPVGASRSEILYAERIDRLQALGKNTGIARPVARGDRGERVLAEYTFNHTPTPPFPTVPPAR